MRIGVQILLIAVSLLCVGCPSRIIGDGDTRTNADLDALATTLNEFKRITGRFPSTDEGLHSLVERNLILIIPNDPWGRPYRYTASPASERGYDLYSLGPRPEKSSDDIHLN